MGLKLRYHIVFAVFGFKLKSDQNGIEMILSKFSFFMKKPLKSDQNGIEMLRRNNHDPGLSG